MDSKAQGIYIPKILIFGDSVVQYSTRPGGMHAILAEKYERKFEIVVRGFEGYNSNHYVEIIQSTLEGLGPGPIAAVFLYTGTNDAAIEESFQHVPIHEFTRNLKTTIRILRKYTDNVIVVPPAYTIDEKRDDRKDADFANYAEAAKRVIENYSSASYQSIKVLDGRRVLRNRKKGANAPLYDPDCFLDDGLHWTPLGYERFADAIIRLLEPLSKEYSTILPSLFAFEHLSVLDQKALLQGHIMKLEQALEREATYRTNRVAHMKLIP